jgi:hypothetical protein
MRPSVVELQRHYERLGLTEWPAAPKPVSRHPVICMELRHRFPSVGVAARYMAKLKDRPIKPAHIRAAIKRGSRCGKLRWRYADNRDCNFGKRSNSEPNA